MWRRRPRNQTDRIIFNGHDLSSLAMCRVGRPLAAPPEASFRAVGANHGERFCGSRLAGFDLQVELWLRTRGRREVAEARHLLAAMLWCEEPSPLYLPDDPTRYLLAMPSGDADLGEISDECPGCTLTFHVGDPAYYGQIRRQRISAGETWVEAGGTWPAHLSLTARPEPGRAWRLTNVGTGEFVELSSPPADGNVIRVDMAAERATVNQAPAAVTISSDFFSIQGRAHLLLSGGTADLEWRERWL